MHNFYIRIYNTTRFCPCYPSDGLFSYIHGSRVEPHQIDSFDWL